MQQSEYLSVFFVCKKPQIIDDHEYRNGNNGHYFVYNNGVGDRHLPTESAPAEPSDDQEQDSAVVDAAATEEQEN